MNTESRIKYSKEILVYLELQKPYMAIKFAFFGNFFERKDFHEDGSISTYRGLEMAEDCYERIIKEIEEVLDGEENKESS